MDKSLQEADREESAANDALNQSGKRDPSARDSDVVGREKTETDNEGRVDDPESDAP